MLNKKISTGKGMLILIIGVLFITVTPMIVLFDIRSGRSDESVILSIKEKLPQKEINVPQGTPYQRVIEVAQKASPNASVLVSGKDATVETSAQPPYEAIVNLSGVDCFDAKVQLQQVMRNLYTDNIAKANISRVLVNVNGQLSASLGATDGKSLSSDQWENQGPTNFFTALRQVGDRANENLPLEQRTWGSSIGGCK